MTATGTRQELVFGRAGQRELKAQLYRPPAGASTDSVLVDVHGGAWYRGELDDGAYYAQRLAQLGIAVLSIEFRDASLGGEHPQAGQDITAAVRYLRTHAPQLGVNPQQIGLIGSSSGGHLAMLAGVLPDAPQHRGTQLNTAPLGVTPVFAEGADVSAWVFGVAALWPVSDPLYRYRFAQRTERPELRAGHEAYFGTEGAMRDASVPHIVADGVAEGLVAELPPLFVVQPGKDRNVPREMTQSLVDAWEQRDGRVSCGFYPAMPHGFACRAGGYTEACIRDVAGFFHGCAAGVAGRPTSGGLVPGGG